MKNLIHSILLTSATQEELCTKLGLDPNDTCGLYKTIADRITHDYLPLPRFEDGESCQIGSKTIWGEVKGISVYSDSSWTLKDEYGNELTSGESDDFIKYPETSMGII